MTVDKCFDIVVVGNGLFGSSTTRHLAETTAGSGTTVACIGAPTEPADGLDPARVYSSHNDRARLTRLQDRDVIWAEVTHRAVGQYQAVEAASGVEFHQPVGCLISSRPGGDGVSPDPREVMDRTDVGYEYWAPGDRGWAERWPDLEFPTTHYVAFEDGPAGHIEPLALIRAQNILSTRAGATLITDVVVGVDGRPGGGFVLRCSSGATIEAGRVVVAAGAFTNLNGLVPEPVELSVKSEVIVLGRVGEDDARRLATVPTVKYLIDQDNSDLEAIYMIGPLQYPDGHHYIKMGANTSKDFWFGDGSGRLADIQAWFESDTDDEYLPIYQPALQALWPRIEFEAVKTQPCIITYSPDRRPVIDQIGVGLFVATAGNGGGAKGSDAWGERAAHLVLSS